MVEPEETKGRMSNRKSVNTAQDGEQPQNVSPTNSGATAAGELDDTKFSHLEEESKEESKEVNKIEE